MIALLVPLSMLLGALWVARRDKRRQFEQTRRASATSGSALTGSMPVGAALPRHADRPAHRRHETSAGCNRRSL